MGMRRLFVVVVAILTCQALASKEIVLGVDMVPQRKMALLFTPVVLPDLISAKAAFEYRLHRHLNLVIPLEAKWMDYRRTIKFAAKLFGASETNVPEDWYRENNSLRVLWNIDLSQFKISSGAGVKWFPFSESMTNAFFVKTLLMVGIERLNAYGAEGKKDGAVFTHVLTVGYNWVKNNRFTFGIEGGEEYTLHTNATVGLPILLDGLMPLIHFNLGFTI